MSILRAILLPIILLTLSDAFAQSVSYAELDQVIPNPERGYYHHTEVHSGQYTFLNPETLKGYRENESITQILRVFYLENFREGPISSAYLQNMRKDFAALRKSGVKAIVRFAYTTKSTGPYGDATPEIVQLHINQLKPVLQENADVIAVMQAGFIGAWGEWYYTDHFANSPGQISQEDWENRRQVVLSILNALPKDRMVQIRTPGYKMTLFGTEEPIDETKAFSGDNISRAGHHNDCFVASSSDFGTYVNPEIEKPYLEQETRFLPMGGETCAVAPPYSDCDFATEELERFHWSYLNKDYNRDVLEEWDDQGCLDEVELRLGYRFKLIEGTYTSATKPGGTFSFELSLQNDGYSNPYNPRLLEIILKHQETGEEYFFAPDEKIRLWPLGEPFSITFQAGLPQDIPEGMYELYLSLPDSYLSLKENPAYAIRMANEEVWDESLGYNNLKQTISIQAENSADVYEGEAFFDAKTAYNLLDLEESDKIFGGSDSSKVLVYWGRQDAGYQRVLERSQDGEHFEIIASLKADADYYIDTDVTANGFYSYRYYLIDADQNRSEHSDTIQLQAAGNIYPSVVLDGDGDDWGAVPPVSSAVHGGGTRSMRVFFGAQEANFLLEGDITDYQIYLNTDNDLSTGVQESESPLQGMDYQLTAAELIRYAEGEWTPTSANIDQAKTNSTIELSVVLTAFQNLTENQVLPIYAEFNSGEVIMQGQNGGPSVLYRALPPDTPQNLAVRVSEQLPDSRLVVTWDACSNCLGYALERSVDNQEFELVGTFEPTTLLIRDDNLTNDITYYYRINSYNELGFSPYSSTVNATTGVLPLSLEQTLPKVYPNPTTNQLFLPGDLKTYEIYSISGKLVKKGKHHLWIDVADLEKGTYILRGNSDQGTRSIKFVKH